MDDLAERIRDLLTSAGVIYALGFVSGLLATWVI